MKAVVTLVQVAEAGDIAKHAAAVDQALKVIADATRHLEGAESRAQTARDALARARLDLGRVLAAARPCWPTRGPNAKGWSAFLTVRGITLEAAQEAMKYAGYVESEFGGDVPDKLPSRREAGLDHRPLAGEDDGQTGPKLVPPPRADDAPPPPFRALTADDIVQALARLPPEERKRVVRESKANALGGSGEKERGGWCTPKALAIAVGPWDVDPFSNPRSHVLAADRCMLENSGDGFGDGSGPGSYRVANRAAEYAGPETRVWLQPPYERGFVRDVVDHYKHARFCALLRWSPDVEWFQRLWPRVSVVAFPIGARIEFEPPPGVDPDTADGAPFPHALLYADERDVTDEVRALCIVWRVDHSGDPAATPIDPPPPSAA